MIITIASNCEDVGKSIIATNTAVLRTLVGRSALLIDIDPKRKSFEWAERRKQASVQPTIAASSLKGKHLKQKFAELSAKYIDVIIDTD
jgi:Mrp family chromosome partitioning ATPase